MTLPIVTRLRQRAEAAEVAPIFEDDVRTDYTEAAAAIEDLYEAVGQLLMSHNPGECCEAATIGRAVLAKLQSHPMPSLPTHQGNDDD